MVSRMHKFWQYVAGKYFPAVSRKSAVLGINDSLAELLRFGSGTRAATASSALQLYEDSSAVSIPVNFVAEAFSSIKPVIMEDGVMIKEAPELELLNQPSPFFTRELMFEMMGKEFLVTGESLIVALGFINRPPVQIQPISTKNATIVEGQNGVAISWSISNNILPGSYVKDITKGRLRYLKGNMVELKQIRRYSTRNGSMLRGQSPLVSASAEARQNILGNMHNTSLLEKGGRLSLVFHYEQDMDDDEYELNKQRIIENYGGASNAGAIKVATGPKLNIKEFGVNNKDMDFAALQDQAKAAVALIYKVPLPLLFSSASTFNNYRVANLALFDDAVLPLADKIFGGLTNMLMPRYGKDPAKRIFTYDPDAITPLAIRRSEELKLRKDFGVETDNELREAIGKDPVDGGDVLYKPITMVPIGTSIMSDDDLGDDSVLDDSE